MSCTTDTDCGPASFCHDGKCFGYWKGLATPWNNCKSGVPGVVSPYCKNQLVRGPSGYPQYQFMPECGNYCDNDGDCPVGCPNCQNNVCMAPTDPTKNEPLPF